MTFLSVAATVACFAIARTLPFEAEYEASPPSAVPDFRTLIDAIWVPNNSHKMIPI